jgi:hypothetical protein
VQSLTLFLLLAVALLLLLKAFHGAVISGLILRCGFSAAASCAVIVQLKLLVLQSGLVGIKQVVQLVSKLLLTSDRSDSMPIV